MPTTSNFGWTTPADTDLVKDGALAIRTLGNGIDTSFLDLKGGTTGQILSKASNTDLDYTWINNDQGDITEVQAGTGISVASGTGPIPVVTNTVATAFDAKGDLIGGTGADTFSRLAVGTDGQVLTADSTTATGLKWATAAAGGKVLQIVQDYTTTEESTTSTTFIDTALSVSITPSSATSKILCIASLQVGSSRSSAIECGSIYNLVRTSTSLGEAKFALEVDTSATENRLVPKGHISLIYLDSPSTTSATTYKVQMKSEFASNTTYLATNSGLSSLILMEIGA